MKDAPAVPLTQKERTGASQDIFCFYESVLNRSLLHKQCMTTVMRFFEKSGNVHYGAAYNGTIGRENHVRKAKIRIFS